METSASKKLKETNSRVYPQMVKWIKALQAHPDNSKYLC